MTKTETSSPLSYEDLKHKQRAIRSGFPEPVGLRIHRALSWLGRAEKEADDLDVRFILLWIGFNSAYGADVDIEIANERDAFRHYFATLVSIDRENRIYNAVWSRFSQEIRLLLDNKFVFSPFWRHHNGEAGCGDWELSLATSKRVTGAALTRRDTALVLSVVFDRLYVLRNQLVHGGATWSSGVNRRQVQQGAAVLGTLLPVFIDLMMNGPSLDWGRPFYPVVE